MPKRKQSGRCRPVESQEELAWNDYWKHKGSLRVKVITRMGAPSVRVIQIEDIPDWVDALVRKG